MKRMYETYVRMHVRICTSYNRVRLFLMTIFRSLHLRNYDANLV